MSNLLLAFFHYFVLFSRHQSRVIIGSHPELVGQFSHFQVPSTTDSPHMLTLSIVSLVFHNISHTRCRISVALTIQEVTIAAYV
jgi:hypothetical protein